MTTQGLPTAGCNTASTAQSVGEAFLAMLKQKGVDYLFINAGTDHATLAEAYARKKTSNLAFPTAIVGAHENLVAGMAHGFTMITGKPQAVMVHVSVGAANAVCAVMNARRDSVPMLFMAGRTPLFEKGRTGSRSGAIHWAQEMYDQAGMVRELVKWDYELRSGINLDEILDRALAISQSAPAGPVYLTLPREILAEEPEQAEVLSQPPAVPSAPAPDPDALRRLAQMIEDARCPVIVTSASGRDPATVHPLGDLCRTFGIGCIEAKSRYVCLPADHPYHLGQSPFPALDKADLIICLECDVPWIPKAFEPGAGTHIVHIAPDPLFTDIPIRHFGGELLITSSTANLLAPLQRALSKVSSTHGNESRQGNIGRLARQRCERRAARLAPLMAAPRMTKDWLNFCLNLALSEDVILVNEYWVDREILDVSQPGSFFMHSPAAGLGWGLPAAIGAALAAPDKIVVCAHGDGSYMFANPAACHHAITLHQLPLVTIVCNNAQWGAVQSSTLDVYPDGECASGPRPTPLSSLSPVPDFEKYVEASGGHGERVTDPGKLVDAIRRALEVVRRERRQVLLNVICD